MRRKENIFTPLMDEAIRKAYRTGTDNGEVKILAEILRMPRWRITRRAREIGAYEPKVKAPDWSESEKEPFKILWITGERREESRARAGYNEIEHHPGNTKRRIVHHWRPMLDWTEQDIWSIIEKHRIMPHPAYYLGFPRLSCRSCIFFTKEHWSTLSDVSPGVIRMLQEVEEDLDFTIDGKFTIEELARMGKSRINEANRIYIKKAVEKWNEAVTTENWQLPSGALGGNEGGSW